MFEYSLLPVSLLCHCLLMMNHKMQNKMPESDEENVLIWRIQFDEKMFRLRKNEIDFMTVTNLYAF